MSAQIKYWDDSYTFKDESKVIEIKTDENGRKIVILDGTIMYPQGGGQPYDKGEIKDGKSTFVVDEVRYIEGEIFHIGHFEIGDNFTENEMVKVSIDQERRKLHSKLHTAGHLVDDAMFELGYKLKPSKGYHFPDGPYVEYFGSLEGDLIQIAGEVEKRINEIIETDYYVHQEIFSSIKEMDGKLMYMPEHIPEGKPIRLVYVSSPTKGQPCGGTHIKHLKEINKISVSKIKVRGGSTRVSYLVK